MDLLLATRNRHKSREFRELLSHDFKVMDLSSFPEVVIPDETGRTFEENASLKAVATSQDRRGKHQLVIADDSGLEVDALDGAPGIYSARYAGEKASDKENVLKLLGDLRGRNAPAEKRTARFRCVIALAKDGKVLETVGGVAEGTIVDPPRGTDGFGYDPVFQPDRFEQTFAEMAPDLKNKISHRAKAIAALRQALRELKN